jgi:hypothetical protein
MSAQPISLAGTNLSARASGALWWPAERLLCVADLHLCKAERLARRGGPLLPPYETAETLERLTAEIEALDPKRVICLGDSFDDCSADAALGAPEASLLTSLMARRDWIWIAGNHDPAPPQIGGRHCAELRLGPLCFRHAAAIVTDPGEVSGHYHPKIRVPVGRSAATRRCFLLDTRRLILPAFGAYTGGLHADAPALTRLLAPDARAVVTGTPCVSLPISCASAAPRARGVPSIGACLR